MQRIVGDIDMTRYGMVEMNYMNGERKTMIDAFMKKMTDFVVAAPEVLEEIIDKDDFFFGFSSPIRG